MSTSPVGSAVRLTLSVVLCCLVAYAGCRRKNPLAELLEVVQGSADKAIQGADWAGAEAGDSFENGDAVRTSEDGEARLKLRNGRHLRLGADTVLRFGAKGLELEGEVEAEDELTLDLAFGQTTLSAGGKLRLKRGDEGALLFDVLLGSAKITSEDGETLTLEEGESLEFDIEIGKAVVKRPEPDAGPPPVVVEDAAPVEDPPEPEPQIAAVVKGRPIQFRLTPEEEWQKLKAGSHALAPGSEVKLPRKSSVRLERGTSVVSVSGKASFSLGQSGGPLVVAGSGELDILATEQPTTVVIPGGEVTALAGRGNGSRAVVNVDRKNVKIAARSGRVSVVGKNGTRETIQLGERIELNRQGVLTVLDRAPKTAHFSIPAGQSPFVHDPKAPTHVRIRFPEQCKSEGIVEIARGASFRRGSRITKGTNSAIVRLSPGSYRYRVRCLDEGRLADKAAASGRIRLNRAAGTKRLPPKPTNNEIHADGLNYSVLYQNLLPNLTFRWPGAPERGAYRLHLTDESGKERTVPAKSNSVRLASGKLSEGRYKFWFTDGRSTSKKSTLRLAFDNAADTGYVRSPSVSQTWPKKLSIEGAAIKGWSVSVDNLKLKLDRQYRFKTSYSIPGGHAGIAIRFSHPSRGIHYYVRRRN